MPYSTLTLATEGDAALITLNRPDRRNAISNQMIDDVLGALGEVEKGPARAAVITGAGQAFCSGMDLEMLRSISTQSPQQNMEDSRRMQRLFYALHQFPLPLIAAVNGPAIAGGCGIATLCDFTLAVPEATFGYTEVRIGFMPALVSVFLIRQVGEKRARDLLLTGRILDAQEAYRLGLVTEIVPAAELQPRALALAATLAANSPSSITRTKRLLNAFAHEQLERELDLAVRENADIRTTDDFREGLASFLEKRKPRWSGR